MNNFTNWDKEKDKTNEYEFLGKFKFSKICFVKEKFIIFRGHFFNRLYLLEKINQFVQVDKISKNKEEKHKELKERKWAYRVGKCCLYWGFWL